MSHINPNLALLVHGFNVRDGGRATIGRLQPFLTTRGWDTVMFKLGFMDIVQVYSQNMRHAERLAEAARNALEVGQRVVALGHSNGAAVLHLATTEFEAPIDRLAYINPALDPRLAPGINVKHLDVWHSPSDNIVKWSRFLPWSVWGQMGSTGYEGSDLRIKNHNKEEMLVSSSEHSDFAKGEKLTYFGPKIVNKVIENEVVARVNSARHRYGMRL